MATAAELQVQLEKLKQARAAGIRSVDYGGQVKVEYRTDAELRQAISDIQADLARLEGTTSPQTVVIRSSKGW